jgi:PKD repeat protein
MRAVNMYQKAIGIMVMGILLALIVQAASGAESDSITVTGFILPHEAPVANFTANPHYGTAPLTVQFKDTSSNFPTSWSWNFGDGSVSTKQDPVHTFGPGLYTITLTATNAAGSTQKVRVKFITAYAPSPPPPTPTPTPPVDNSVSDSDGGGGTAGTAGGTTAAGGTGGTAALGGVTLPGQLGPLWGEQVSVNYDLTVAGSSTTTGSTGQQELMIDRADAEKAGATIEVTDKLVEIVQEGFTLTVVAENIEEKNGIITGENVKSINLATTPQEATISGVGTVSTTIEAGLSSLPEGAAITTTISDQVTSEVQNAFQVATLNAGLEITAIAYTMSVTKTGIETTKEGATVTMTVPPGWVDAHGGQDAIHIVRMDDKGIPEVLVDTHLVVDEKGNMILDKYGNMQFEAISPNGLSIFGMVSAKATAIRQQEGPGVTIQPITNPAMFTDVGMFSWLAGILLENPIAIVIVIAIIAVVLYAGWWKRRV